MSKVKTFRQRVKEALKSSNPVLTLSPEIAKKLGLFEAKESKYNVAPPEDRTHEGVLFASALEAQRHAFLQMLERSGTIRDLRRQVKYELLPPFTKGEARYPGIYYLADHVYTGPDNEEYVEDTKGTKTAIYLLKRQFLLFTYPTINFREVTIPNDLIGGVK